MKPEMRDDGCVYWKADSDSQLTKGLAALLVLGLSGCKPEDILQVTIFYDSMTGGDAVCRSLSITSELSALAAADAQRLQARRLFAGEIWLVPESDKSCLGFIKMLVRSRCRHPDSATFTVLHDPDNHRHVR